MGLILKREDLLSIRQKNLEHTLFQLYCQKIKI